MKNRYFIALLFAMFSLSTYAQTGGGDINAQENDDLVKKEIEGQKHFFDKGVRSEIRVGMAFTPGFSVEGDKLDADIKYKSLTGVSGHFSFHFGDTNWGMQIGLCYLHGKLDEITPKTPAMPIYNDKCQLTGNIPISDPNQDMVSENMEMFKLEFLFGYTFNRRSRLQLPVYIGAESWSGSKPLSSVLGPSVLVQPTFYLNNRIALYAALRTQLPLAVEGTLDFKYTDEFGKEMTADPSKWKKEPTIKVKGLYFIPEIGIAYRL